MKFYIPDIGDKIKLTKDWNFDLYSERRNLPLGKALGLAKDKIFINNINKEGYHKYWDCEIVSTVTLIKGTELIVDRVYVRNGGTEYSSITFRISNHSDKKYLKKRFWVKLRDSYNIEFNKVD